MVDCRTAGAAVGAVHVHVHEAGAWTRRRIDTKNGYAVADIVPVQGQATDEADDGVRELNNSLRFPFALSAPPL